VREQRGPQLGDRGRGHAAADPQAADNRAERAADLGDRDVLVRVAPGGRVILKLGHARAPFERPWLSAPSRRPPRLSGRYR
jgi:hypothetical protein